jgi:hypothetical protein
MNATARNFKNILPAALALLSLLAASASATAPNTLTYQGRLKESGLPVTAVRTVDVQICDSFTGGICTTTGGQPVAVTNGLFRTTFTVPSSISLQNGAWFLEVHVGGSAFGPRELLSAGAYAIYASSAATLTPNPGDASVFIASDVAVVSDGFSVGGATFVVTGGNVGVGTASPGSALEVNGTLTLSGDSHVEATGAGVAVAAVSSCGGSPSIVGSDAAGRVTLGTGSPASCQIVFGTSWTNPPVCHFTNESGNSQAYSISAVDAFSVTFRTTGPMTTGDVINYTCLGY